MKPMIRSLVAVAIVALAASVALADVLYEETFDDGLIHGYQETYETGGRSGEGGGVWRVRNGWLETGNGDNPVSLIYWVTGDEAWSDVAVQSHVGVDGQGWGWTLIFARFQDNRNYYALRYSTGFDDPLPGDVQSSFDPSLRLEKVVDGKTVILAETGESLPEIQNLGKDNETGAVFRLEVQGNTLRALVNGEERLVATDPDGSFSAGRVGLGQMWYYPLWDYIRVESL